MIAHPHRFPLNVRAAVKILGGQTKAAARVGCRVATLSDWGRGSTADPDQALTDKLAAAVGVLPEVLLWGDVTEALAAQRATVPAPEAT